MFLTDSVRRIVQERDLSGLGLGLAIVKHLVELRGGSTYATSAGEGKGST
jgi:signal transduction histidine kinase